MPRQRGYLVRPGWAHGDRIVTVYEYDAANRVTEIDHRDPLDVSLLTYTYTYRKDNLVKQIDDYTVGVGTTTTFYRYDDRGRLVIDLRTTFAGYTIQYAYDEGGNRITKLDSKNDIRVDYVYDISDPAGYGSANNRLMSYKTWDISDSFHVLLSETFYYYNCSGNRRTS